MVDGGGRCRRPTVHEGRGRRHGSRQRLGTDSGWSAPSLPLIHPIDTSQFPDLSAGFVSGTMQYAADTGQLSIQNVPYAMATGTSSSSQFDVIADAANQRSQTINVTLNPDGTVKQSAGNSYN